MSDLYYIQDSRSYVGNDVLWWGPDRAGYTCKIENAGLYSKEDAYSQFKNRETDIPWPQKYIDGITCKVVDHQKMNREQSGEILPDVERWTPKPTPPENCSGCGRFMPKDGNPYVPCSECQTEGRGDYP